MFSTRFSPPHGRSPRPRTRPHTAVLAFLAYFATTTTTIITTTTPCSAQTTPESSAGGCPQLATPQACCANAACGWCAASYTCMAGDEAGPDAPSVGCPCDSWCGGANDYAGCLASNPGGALELLAPDTFVEVRGASSCCRRMRNAFLCAPAHTRTRTRTTSLAFTD